MYVQLAFYSRNKWYFAVRNLYVTNLTLVGYRVLNYIKYFSPREPYLEQNSVYAVGKLDLTLNEVLYAAEYNFQYE